MCTGAKKEVVAQIPRLEVKPKAQPEPVKVGGAKQGECCDPDCGPSTCGR